MCQCVNGVNEQQAGVCAQLGMTVRVMKQAVMSYKTLQQLVWQRCSIIGQVSSLKDTQVLFCLFYY